MGQSPSDQLIDSIYEAALEPQIWPSVLVQLRDEFQASSAHLFAGDSESLEIDFLEAVGLDETGFEPYRAHWVTRDPRIEYGMGVKIGEVFRDTDFISESEMDREPYFVDFMNHLGGHYGMSARPAHTDRRSAALTIQRNRSQNPFPDRNVELFGFYARHIGRSLEISWRLQTESSIRREVGAVIEAVEYPLILIDDLGHCAVRNQAAESILADCDGLMLRTDKLRFDDSIAAAKYGALVSGLAGRGTPQAEHADPIVVRRPSGQAPYLLQLFVLRSNWRHHGRPITGLLSIEDLSIARSRNPAILQDVLGLTKADARFASVFASTGSLTETADTLRLTRETARWRIKQLFSKTGTKGQADLVGLILRISSSKRSNRDCD